MSTTPIIDRYPALKAVTLELMYDNGMVNREQTEGAVLESFDAVLGAEGVYTADLERVEEFLAGLSREEQYVVACGEHEEMTKITARGPRSDEGIDLVDALLNDLFDSEGPGARAKGAGPGFYAPGGV